MIASKLPPTPPPAVIREAQLRCQAMNAAGELPRIFATPNPTYFNTSMGYNEMHYAGVRYIRDPKAVEHCVDRMTAMPEGESRADRHIAQ